MMAKYQKKVRSLKIKLHTVLCDINRTLKQMDFNQGATSDISLMPILFKFVKYIFCFKTNTAFLRIELFLPNNYKTLIFRGKLFKFSFSIFFWSSIHFTSLSKIRSHKWCRKSSWIPSDLNQKGKKKLFSMVINNVVRFVGLDERLDSLNWKSALRKFPDSYLTESRKDNRIKRYNVRIPIKDGIKCNLWMQNVSCDGCI